jgi:hypothetical protein
LIHAQGRCQPCYTAAMKSGEIQVKFPPGRTIEQRVFDRLELSPDGCWLWPGSKTPEGYGRFTSKETGWVSLHRWVYEYLRTEIPEGLHLDHLCRNPSCVNPWHLEPVTVAVNIRRGAGFALKMTCPKGHPYNEANTRWWKDIRLCLTCKRDQWSKAHNKKREARLMEQGERCCVECGASLADRTSRAKYCSGRCRQRAYAKQTTTLIFK